eukprot:88916_1
MKATNQFIKDLLQEIEIDGGKNDLKAFVKAKDQSIRWVTKGEKERSVKTVGQKILDDKAILLGGDVKKFIGRNINWQMKFIYVLNKYKQEHVITFLSDEIDANALVATHKPITSKVHT